MGARPEPLDLGPAPGAKPHASPSVRKFARELGVELTAVRGSGPKGRITEDDVRSHVKGVMASGVRSASSAAAPSTGVASHLPAWPQVDFAKFGPIKRVEMSRIRRISGPALTRNWVTIPHVTNHDDADITELEAFRVQLNKENEKSGLKLTMLAFLIKACVAALKKFPEFNSSIDAETGDAVILKEYFHIGFAADTPNGLVVPVVKDADKKGRHRYRAGNRCARGEGARRQAQPDRHAGRYVLDLVAGRHRWYLLHADHQRARGRDPWRMPLANAPGVGRQAVRAAPDPAVVVVVGSPRRRRRRRRALQRVSGASTRRLSPRALVKR